MVSRTLSPCSHGWVDERAAPPHLVTSPLLQSPADVLETQQTVLTVFPRVRLHPFSSSLFNIISMGIKNSEHHSLWASLNFGPQFNALENTMRAFLGTNWNINPRSWVCHQRLSGFAIYFTFSIIGYSKRRRHRSQKPIHSGPNKWIFIGSLVCIWLSLGSINPQIVKPHWPQPLALRKNRLLGMELWKCLENLLSEISQKAKSLGWIGKEWSDTWWSESDILILELADQFIKYWIITHWAHTAYFIIWTSNLSPTPV